MDEGFVEVFGGRREMLSHSPMVLMIRKPGTLEVSSSDTLFKKVKKNIIRAGDQVYSSVWCNIP